MQCVCFHEVLRVLHVGRMQMVRQRRGGETAL